MFGSAETGELSGTLGARSVPGRWHFLRRWHTARRISGCRRTSPAQGHSLYGTVLPGRKAMRRTGFPHTQGKERAGKMAFIPRLAHCPADFRVQEDFPNTGSQLVWGCAARQKGSTVDGLLRHLWARSAPGRWHLLRCWHTVRRTSGQRQGFPAIWAMPPQNKYPRRTGHAVRRGGVFMYGNRTDQTSS